MKKKVNHEDERSRKEKIVCLSTAQHWLKPFEVRADHEFLVHMKDLRQRLWPDEGVPEERSDFDEGVEHAWSEM